VLSVVLLTVFAIASMNNWRGGWTIGPRYLALCVPFLAWPALVALDAWAERAPRSAASVAIGCTAVGLCASGVPSAYYPHLPPELTRPLPQLFALLIRHDFAPTNAGAFFGVFGTISMLPLLLVALCALSVCLRSLAAGTRTVVLASACALALLLSVPIWTRPQEEPGVREALAFITRRFWPAGHDQAARLRAQVLATPKPSPGDLLRLAALYRAEGRDDEARALTQQRR
jgi:hypothetical protein